MTGGHFAYRIKRYEQILQRYIKIWYWVSACIQTDGGYTASLCESVQRFSLAVKKFFKQN